MLTKNEISTLNLSPTKKDFVQIWNELLEVAGNLSERWDPTSTNESDPGIVILKAVTGIADKLNYNIDKNTLEAFMPTAAQEDSMRKLCDMLGYNMKYYRSAETTVTIKYHNSDPSEEESNIMSRSDNLAIPKFTVITNADKDISYFTTNQTPVYISSKYPTVTVNCMEGQIVKCESTVNNNVITLAQLSEGNKFYLPETQIAENGIFIYNVSSLSTGISEGAQWEKVDNLNIQARGARVFKFGYNSYEGRPYVEFPADCSELIGDGLFIYYARTSGANGNVSVNTLTQIELPTGDNWSKVSAESFSATNSFAATSGANLETIGQAYNNFKKTVGTFETLVTCRDYMNKIYTMVSDSGKSYVSNVLVTDIRNDLNRTVTICSCDDAGIYYKETPLTITVEKELKAKNGDTVTVLDEEPLINHFDLVIYPFKSYTQIRSISTPVQSTYESSFTYNPQNFSNIETELNNTGLKTIAHNFKKPQKDDILSINNYLRLNAIVGTNNKVSTEEILLLKEKIKIALANAFNMRELDFGEEIPFENIVDVIEHADPRIKVVSLNEPDLYTTFTVIDEVVNDEKVVIKEYAVASEGWLTTEQATASKRFETDTPSNGTFDTKTARQIYNKLVVRNILAGRVPLFKYNTTFTSDFSEKPYQVTNEVTFENLPKVCQNYFNSAAAYDPYLLWVDGAKPENLAAGDTHVYGTGDVYARELVNPDAAENSEKYKYTKTETPKELVEDDDGNLVPTSKYPDNIVKPEEGDKITKIESECTITPPGGSDRIEDVTLAAGEQIKFRAPNFRTKETYPAYVNYHLHLDRPDSPDGGEAKSAVASNLYSLMTTELWEKLLEGVESKVLKQKVSNVTTGTSNKVPNIDELAIEDILYQSGCIKLYTTPTFRDATTQETLDFEALGFEKGFGKINIAGIPETNDAVLIHSQTVLDSVLETINDLLYQNKKDFDWEISYEIKYVPFTSANLSDVWYNFVYTHINFEGKRPFEENRINMWRKYTGSSYPAGKYILDGGAKLLPFTEDYFGELDTKSNLSNRLQGIYIIENPGRDAVVDKIANDTEYKLRANEYLCIKYTPSSTSEDGTVAKDQAPITKIIKNIVIRPSGFTDGLKDSTAFQKEGNSPVGHSDFISEDGTTRLTGISLFSLGVNEQIEIREPSAVALTKASFTEDDAVIYVYKNFNNCPELETIQKAENGQRRNATYILKEGEYIFYTDKNKSELAYYSTGTGITLTGNVKIPTFDIIDISTILDAGISEIPWKAVSVAGANDGINFQEYQYKTLSQNDTLNTLRIVDKTSPKPKLDSIWRKCADVSYTIAGETKPEKLPIIDIDDSEGNGWEASSLLEINASPSVAQTLRTTDKVQTKISLYGIKNGTKDEAPLKVIKAEPNFPLSFKTNVTGQSSTGVLALSDIYLNTDADSFTFKVTAEEAPAVLAVQEDTILPVSASMPGSADNIAKGINSWSQVPLKELGSKTEDNGNINYNALKLSTTILPNTYGIFSIYLKQASAYTTSLKLLPGSDPKAISFFNSNDEYSETDGLVLKPRLNCIRVAKSCDIYINSDSPDGILCFDTLRLVDVSPTDDNQGTTYGLNLEQLGYLNTSDEGTWNEIDSRARKNLKNALTKEALTKVDSRLQELNNNVAVAQATLDADKPKVETIKKFLEKSISELDALIKTDDSDKAYKTDATITSLINQFNALEEALQAEKGLQKSLEDNSAIEDITKSLAELLEDFDDIASLQEGLTTELANLYNSVLTNAENIEELPQESIVDDFVNALTNPKYTNDIILNNYLKIASLNEINIRYDDQINTIVSAVSKNNEEILAKKVYSLKYYEILNLVKELYGTNNPIDDIFNSITTALTAQNFENIRVSLYNLKDVVKKLDLTALLNKIEFSATDLQYTELAQYLSDLQLIYDATDSALVRAIDSTIDLVSKQISTPTQDNKDAAIAAINNLQNSIWKTIKDSSNVTISNIQNVLDELMDFFDFTNNELKNDSLDEVLKAQLNALLKARAAVIKTTELFVNITDYDKLPFSTEAILTVWPEYMKKDLLEKVEPLYNDIRAIVRDLENNDDITLTELDNRLVLKKLANITLFKKLYKRAKDLAYKSEQVDSRKGIIEELSARALDIPDVMDKLNEFIGTESEPIDDANKLVIYNLATQLKNTAENDVIAQQQILIELKEELSKLIKLDESLLEITAEMLSPSILLLRGLPEDTFYDEVRNFINTEGGIKKQVLGKVADKTITNAKNDITAKLSADKSTLKDNSLLPQSYQDNVAVYNSALALIPAAKPTDWDIFKILLDDTLKAAWLVTPDQGNSYWIDLAGEKIATSDLPAYNYRYYDEDNKDDKAEGWYKSDNLNTVINAESYITNISTGAALQDTKLQEILTWLIEGEDTDGDKIRDGGVKAIGAYNIPESFRKALDRLSLEVQLLDEIKELDKNHLFYYNTPVEADVAIDFNEGDSKLNTLMNPATNYDINNVNNSFVISKLDIGYLDSGIQIARSSRL